MVRFMILDGVNTWEDWQLVLTTKDAPPPTPKTNLVNIDGRNGSLDLSEALTGEVSYNDRVVSASFLTNNGSKTDRIKLLTTITTALHGKKINIVEPDDLDHFFCGRFEITDIYHSEYYSTFSAKATCEPWRYANEESNLNYTVADGETVIADIYNNGAKTLFPELTVVGEIEISDGEVTATLTSGTYKTTGIRLRHGDNTFEISGAGTVAITYREAGL